jgi:hypothetical protein
LGAIPGRSLAEGDVALISLPPHAFRVAEHEDNRPRPRFEVEGRRRRGSSSDDPAREHETAYKVAARARELRRLLRPSTRRQVCWRS